MKHTAMTLIFIMLLISCLTVFPQENPDNRPLDLSHLKNADLVKVETRSLHGSYKGKMFIDILEKEHFNDPRYKNSRIEIIRKFPDLSPGDRQMWETALGHYQTYINSRFYNPGFKGYSDLSNYGENLRLSFHRKGRKWVLYYIEDAGPSGNYSIWITMDEKGSLLEAKEYFMPRNTNY